MKTFVILLVAVWTTTVLPSQGVQAASPRLPATVYPRGAHITYRPILTNAEMDCLWGFICDGPSLPNFHCATQDQLHRLGGWGQFAGIQHHGRTTMAFELFVSRYASGLDETGTPWSRQAYLDLEMALGAQGYHLDRRDAGLLPVPHGGAALVAVQELGKQDLVVMAFWSGTLEIEGIALYDHRPLLAKQTAWGSLALQIHLASHRGT